MVYFMGNRETPKMDDLGGFSHYFWKHPCMLERIDSDGGSLATPTRNSLSWPHRIPFLGGVLAYRRLASPPTVFPLSSQPDLYHHEVQYTICYLPPRSKYVSSIGSSPQAWLVHKRDLGGKLFSMFFVFRTSE